MRKKSIIKRLAAFIKPDMTYLLIALVFAVISVAATLVTPVLIGRAIDHIVGKGEVDFKGVLPYLGLIAAALITVVLFQWLMALCTNIISQRTVLRLRTQAFSHLHKVPLSYIDTNPHGDIISRVINDIDQVANGLLQGFQQFFSGIVTIVGTILFMLAINVNMAMVVILITPLSLLVATVLTRLTYKQFKKQSELQGRIGSYIEEMVGNQSVVKAFSYEKRAESKFAEINTELYGVGVKAQFYSAMVNPGTRFVNGLVYTGTAVFGALSVLQNPAFTIGFLSSFLSYAGQYTKPFNEISGVVAELQSAFASARRIFELLDSKTLPDDSNNRELSTCDGTVDIKHVYFSYTPDRKLIEDFNLNVKSGQRTAIVGPTGCGKTTLINLLMRFYDVNSGEISVSGEPIKALTRKSLRRSYGMVLQDTWLFKGTVKENISYAKPDATDDEIIAAAKSAHAHSFIKRLPSGYDTVIGDDSGISQGQKQLLCIARVMLSLPPMLILDEATSSIDTRTEMRIQRAFTKMMDGRTSFIIAHRLSTIKEADCILVMESGKIIETGTHDELLAKGGFYANLYNSQFTI